MGPLICRFSSINILENFLEISTIWKEHFLFSTLLYCRNTVCNTYTKYVLINCYVIIRFLVNGLSTPNLHDVQRSVVSWNISVINTNTVKGMMLSWEKEGRDEVAYHYSFSILSKEKSNTLSKFDRSKWHLSTIFRFIRLIIRKNKIKIKSNNEWKE